MPIFADFWPILRFLVHFDIALWERFGPFLRYFWDSLGFSGGPPRFISPILGQFWPFLTTFGPFLDYLWADFFLSIFAEKWHFGPEISAEYWNTRNSIAPPPPGSQWYSAPQARKNF